MILKEINQALVEIVDATDQEIDLLKSKFTYVDKSKTVLFLRFKNNLYLRQKMGEEAYLEHLNKLKADTKVCLILKDKGKLFTYSGIVHYIKDLIPDVEVKSLNSYTEPVGMPWSKIPPAFRYYQREAFDSLILNKKGAVSIPTGGGKSLIITNLAKYYGLKTVIMVPTGSIANQLYDDLTNFLGSKNVGIFGDGKKDFKKKIVICIDKSLLRVKKGTPEYKELSSASVAIVDESHMVATSVQEFVMLGLLKDAEYRFFFSATQFRNDGADLLLAGLTGPVVYDVSFTKLVKEGFLAKPKFIVIKDRDSYSAFPKDPLAALGAHFYKNKKIHKLFAEMANRCILKENKKVMIMIDRIEQFSLLLPHLKVKPKFAYGSLTTEQKKTVPKEYHGVKTKDLVKQFNDGEIDLLIGTRAIGMGTDTRPVDVIFNLQGGQSDGKFMQLIGRGTRKVEGKDCFYFFDIDNLNHPNLHKWALSRQQLFAEMSDEISYME